MAGTAISCILGLPENTAGDPQGGIGGAAASSSTSIATGGNLAAGGQGGGGEQVGCGTRYYDAINGDDPVGWWRFDDGTGKNEISGSGGGGGGFAWANFVTGPAVEFEDSLVCDQGQSIRLNGSDESAVINMGSNFLFSGTQEFTVELWMWIEGTTPPKGSSRRLAGVTSSAGSYRLEYNGTEVQLVRCSALDCSAKATLDEEVNTMNLIKRRRISYVAATFGPSEDIPGAGPQGCVYELNDDVPDRARVCVGMDFPVSFSGQPLFAVDPNKTEGDITFIDEVAVYNKRLSEATIRAHFNAGRRSR